MTLIAHGNQGDRGTVMKPKYLIPILFFVGCGEGRLNLPTTPSNIQTQQGQSQPQTLSLSQSLYQETQETPQLHISGNTTAAGSGTITIQYISGNTTTSGASSGTITTW